MLRIEVETNLGNVQTDLSPMLKAFHAYMVKQTDVMFAKAGGSGSAYRGGEARGERWMPFALQYTRKDGTEVPAWGIPGEVRGRQRPSGKPVTPASFLMQDTGRMRQRAANDIVEIRPSSLVFGTNLEYAAAQDAMRPFLFFTEQDADKAAQMMADYILGEPFKGGDADVESYPYRSESGQ